MPAVAKQVVPLKPASAKSKIWKAKRRVIGKLRSVAAPKKRQSVRTSLKSAAFSTTKIQVDLTPERLQWQNSLVKAGAKLLIE